MLNVVDEARRCLNCKKPLCMEAGCPIKTKIPEMIREFLSANINEAGEILFKNNPLSLVCSLICNHENQCEGHCVLNKKGMPVQISSIEHYISDSYLYKIKPSSIKKNGRRIGIIGSGPAGITIAILLAQRGYDITIFDGKDKIGGVMRYGIPEFRLPKAILDRYENTLINMDIKIRPNTVIGEVIGIEEMLRDGFEAIFIGTGVWRPNSLGIRGETLGNVHYAINYLANPDVYHLGNSVAIIGAGNSAVDVARTVLRKGVRQVTIFERSNRSAANSKEVEYAKIEGVQFKYNKIPIEFNEEGIIFEDTQFNEKGELVSLPESKRFYPFDNIIVSISQGPHNRIVSTTSGIDISPDGLLITDKNGHTSREGIFASGDVVLGAKTVVEAVAYSKQVADAMDHYLRTKQR